MVDDKLTLKREEDLKVYFFLGRPVKLNMQITGEHPFYTLAYNREEALRRGVVFMEQQLGYPMTQSTLVSAGSIPVDALLENIETKAQKVASLPSQEQFVYGLELARDEYLKDDKDKKLATRVINKIRKQIDGSKAVSKKRKKASR